MRDVLLVAVGGAAGALVRYAAGLLFLKFEPVLPAFPFATLVVNTTGSFMLGLLTVLVVERTTLPPGAALLIGTGFLGSYTTFSTLMWDTFALSQGGTPAIALLNVLVSLGLGLAAVALGFYAGRAL